MYYLLIDYDEESPESYRGIVIGSYKKKKFKELIRANTGSPQLDEKRALRQLYSLVGEVQVSYMSSYDNYYMDLEYENDPEYRADVDAENERLDKIIEDYKIELGKEELSIEEYNYIINRKENK